MKVALIHYRLILRGGLETRLLNYASWFQAKGWQVDIIVSKVDKSIQVPRGVQVVRLKLGMIPKPWRPAYFNHRLGKWMREHTYDFSLSLGRTSHQQAVLCPGNHIGYLKAMGGRATSLIDRESIRMDKLAYASSEWIFAASEMMKNEIIKWYDVPEKKIQVLYPPLNTERFHRKSKKAKYQIREQLGWPIDQKIFLFVSTAHHRKGLPLLEKVFKSLTAQNFQLYVAGTAPRASSSPNIHYVGHVENPGELYAAADFTLHPALYEPFGQVVTESLACGTPVIISFMTGAAEIMDANCGMVLPDFAENTWANAIAEADPGNFMVPENIIDQKGLELNTHMRKMLTIVESRFFEPGE